MQTIGRIFGILALIGMVLGMIPLLGWLNWLNIPLDILKEQIYQNSRSIFGEKFISG